MAVENKMTSVTSIIFVVGIIIFFALFFQNLASTILNSPNQRLSNDSLDYANRLAGTPVHINTSEYDGATALQSPVGGDDPENKNDFSIDFNFGKKSTSKTARILYVITNVPEYILFDIFALVQDDYKWVVDILDWLWRCMIFLAIIFAIRGLSK